MVTGDGGSAALGTSADTDAMLRGSLHCAGLRVDVFHAPGTEHADQDRWMVVERAGGVRVAAIDGVTPWRSPQRPVGDPAQWAASTVATALSLPSALDAALQHANTMLHEPGLTISRKQSMAAVAAVDCFLEDGAVRWSGVVSADCEIWAVTGGSAPRLVAGGSFLRPDVHAFWLRTLHDRRGQWTSDQLLSAEARLLEDPRTQLRHAVGRYREPVFEEAEGFDGALIVASDGACLPQAFGGGGTISELEPWLGAVEGREVHDDITCLVVRPL